MKRKFYFVLSLVLLLSILFTGGCATQPDEAGGIEGTVTEANGKPVAGMRVIIVSGTTGFPEMAAITNEEGYYRLGSIPPGTFEVAVHDMEGKRIGLESVVVRSGETSTLDFVVPVAAAAADSKLTEERFSWLLRIQDIRNVLVSPVDLISIFRDYKETAVSEDPEQAAVIDSFFVLTFQTEDGMNSLAFSVIDFVSQTSAQDHFEKVKSETPGLEDTEPPIGDASAKVEVNAQGIGSIIVFIKGNKVIELHTAMPAGEQALVNLEGLVELAREVEERL